MLASLVILRFTHHFLTTLFVFDIFGLRDDLLQVAGIALQLSLLLDLLHQKLHVLIQQKLGILLIEVIVYIGFCRKVLEFTI